MPAVDFFRCLRFALGCLAGLWVWVCMPADPRAEPPSSPSDGDIVKTVVYSVDIPDARGRRGGSPVVYLHDVEGRRFLPIMIGECEAWAIWRRLHRVEFPRPLTHDLFQSVLEAAEIRIRSILIDQLRGGTYFAVLTLQHAGNPPIRLDARPSDAMALAVRMDIPVFVARKILDENAIRKQDHMPEPPPHEGPGPPPKPFY